MRRLLWAGGILLLAAGLRGQDDPRDLNRDLRRSGTISELLRDRIRVIAEVYEAVEVGEIKEGLVQVLNQPGLTADDLVLLPGQPEERLESVIRGGTYDKRLPGVLFLTLREAESLAVEVPQGEKSRVLKLPLEATGQATGAFDVYRVETHLRNQALEGLRFKVNDRPWEDALSFLKTREAEKLVSSYAFRLKPVSVDLNALRDDEITVDLAEGPGGDGLHSVVKFHMRIDEIDIRVGGSTSSFGFGIILSGANYVLANLRFQSRGDFRIDKVQHGYRGARSRTDLREALGGEFRLVDLPYGTKEARFVPENELPSSETPVSHFCFYRELDDAPPGLSDSKQRDYTTFQIVVTSESDSGGRSYEIVETFKVHVYEVRGKEGKLAKKGTISLEDLRNLDPAYGPSSHDLTRDFNGNIYQRRVRRR